MATTGLRTEPLPTFAMPAQRRSGVVIPLSAIRSDGVAARGPQGSGGLPLRVTAAEKKAQGKEEKKAEGDGEK